MIARVAFLLGTGCWILSYALLEMYDRLYLPHAGNHNAMPMLKNASLKIVQFADLHFGEDNVKDRTSEWVMREVLSIERPDIVVFSGDQISGHAIWSAKERRKHWRQALMPASSAGIPFATVFGNHDDQPYQMDPLLWNKVALGVAAGSALAGVFAWCCLHHRGVQIALSLVFFASSVAYLLTVPNRSTRVELVWGESQDSPALSMTRQGVVQMHAVSNYKILLGLGNVSVALYFIDTGGGWIDERVYEDQVKWIRGQRGGLFALAFMHIPPVKFRQAYAKDKCAGMESREGVSEVAGSDELVDALLQIGVRGVFVGHDHGNQWCCPYKGIQLCYGRHSGMGGYDFDEKSRGARVIMISVDTHGSLHMDTWIREIAVG
jgi:hypothetical protein